MSVGIAVFAKLPVPGKVKTRLAATLGDQAAAQAYSAMLDHVLQECVLRLPKPRFTAYLYVDPFASLGDYRRHFGELPLELVPQIGADLGARLTHALGTLAERHEIGMAIGTDCIELAPAQLTRAADLLERGSPLVLGPADDGGYYLLATKGPAEHLFRDIPWSTDRVLAETIDRAASVGWKADLLERLPDIDDERAWRSCRLANKA